MAQRSEHFLGTVDVRHLHEFDWPIVRLLNRSFVERLELQRFKRQLLTSHQYDRIRAVPHRDGEGKLSTHTFELYGVRGPDLPESARAAASPVTSARDTLANRAVSPGASPLRPEHPVSD
jgi:hypothetical protein